MLNREDVIRIVENVISERGLMSVDDFVHGLQIDVKDGDFTMPNNRTVIVTFNGKPVASAWFDVVQTREYEG